MPRDTEAFLRIMNADNERIAAREAAQKAEEASQKELRGDPFRIAHDKARREKYGQLRAREHSGSRPIKARAMFRSNVYPD